MIDWNKSAELNEMSVADLKAHFDKYPQSNKRVVSICDNCSIERVPKFQDYFGLCRKCAKNTDDAKEDMSKIKKQFYIDHPEALEEMSKTMKQYYIDNPSARLLNTLRQIQYNKDHPEKGDNHSRKMTEYWSDKANRDAMSARKLQYYRDHPEAIEAMSETSSQYFIDHPEAIEAARLKAIEQFSSSEARNNHSDILFQYYDDNPEAKESARIKTIEHFSDQANRDAMSEIMKNSDAAKISAENQRGGNDIVMHHWLYDDADLSKYTMPMTRSEHTAMHWRMREDGYEVPHINSDTDDNGLWGYN